MSAAPGGGDPTEPPLPPAGTWTVDASSTIGFVARQFLVQRVRGRFESFRGAVSVAADGTSEVWGEVDASSIATGDQTRDSHLRSAGFLDVERWPTMALVGRLAGTAADGSPLVDTDLTIRGVTRPVAFAIRGLRVGTDGAGATTLTATATATVNRKDFGLRWTPALETAGVVVADRVDLHLGLRVRRTGDWAPAPAG